MTNAYFARTKENELPAYDHQDGCDSKIINRIPQFCDADRIELITHKKISSIHVCVPKISSSLASSQQSLEQ